jgi:hypothetical protein
LVVTLLLLSPMFQTLMPAGLVLVPKFVFPVPALPKLMPGPGVWVSAAGVGAELLCNIVR